MRPEEHQTELDNLASLISGQVGGMAIEEIARRLDDGTYRRTCESMRINLDLARRSSDYEFRQIGGLLLSPEKICGLARP